MAGRRRKRLPKDFADLLEQGDLTRLRAVFDDCLLDARGGHAKYTALAFDACPDELARWLVAQGADLEAQDAAGDTPLHRRARSGHGRIGVLLELGADVHATNGRTGTPLHAAAAGRNVEHVRLLIDHGAAVDAVNADRLTPLELALRTCTNIDIERMVPTAQTLLDAGAARTAVAEEYVERIGQRFEFFRDQFAADGVAAASDALDRLYVLFGTTPVPRRRVHDGTTPISVTSSRWQEQHAELWDLLVPAQGPAATVQGEVVRISGRIARELEGNGGANWDGEFRSMARAFAEHVATGTSLPDPALASAQSITDTLARKGRGDTNRLAELAVAWVLLNPAPVPLGRPDYRR
ncbi:ankyrin repeat domain-containing protein [Cellulomonas sp. P5_C5]